jgi:hypothetical protein
MYSSRSKELSDNIRHFCSLLAEKYDAKLVGVFGSTVKGTWMEGSDVDIIVISDKLERNPLERFIDIKQPDFDAQVFGYTTDEAERMISDLNLFLITALKEAKIMSCDDEYLSQIMARLAIIQKENSLVEIENGWSYAVPA